MTIYEIDGTQYTGGNTIDIKSHPRLLSFVKLCVGNREYSISSDDLVRAIGRAISHIAEPENEILAGGPADLINQFAEEKKPDREPELR